MDHHFPAAMKNLFEIWDVEKMIQCDVGQVNTIASASSPFVLGSLKDLNLWGNMPMIADERTLLLIGHRIIKVDEKVRRKSDEVHKDFRNYMFYLIIQGHYRHQRWAIL